MSVIAAPGFSIHEFLHEESQKDLLRFSTAGSVDDGKSTLIGRLLYDTQSVYEDQIHSIKGKGSAAAGQIDFALLTDGLRAEREQGITIDVAYRYFSTARRKFIIADTPGHEQYTRNMATGASTADAAIVLIDASKGVLVQSRRHAYIASMLRVRHVLVAVNKMDLVGYDEAVFKAVKQDFSELLAQIAADTGNSVETVFIPVSALAGDNVVHRSNAMAWYYGPSLLEVLESLPASADAHKAPFRYPVQRVVRPDQTFRGFAGQIASGSIRTGDSIAVLPSRKNAKVERIVTWDGDLEEARSPLSVTLVLDRELDISRGDLITSSESPATVTQSLSAALVWMDQRPLDRNRRYLLKHNSHVVPAHVSTVDYRTNIGNLTRETGATLEMNAIGQVTLSLLRPIVVDLYSANRSMGAFILIDPMTNGTVAAGMIRSVRDAVETDGSHAVHLAGAVSSQERATRWGHIGTALELVGTAGWIDSVERSLFAEGSVTVRLDVREAEFAERPAVLRTVVDHLTNSGVIVLLVEEDDSSRQTARVNGAQVVIGQDTEDDGIAVVRKLLVDQGIILSTERRGAR